MKTKLAESSSDTIREEVRQRYGATARGESSCADDCCTSTSSDALGYAAEDSAFAPEAENAKLNGFDNVEFRLGEIEALPVADESVDVIISNCVINLSPQKERVFREAFRVLRTGGRLAVADIVATAPLPEEVKGDWAAYTGCMAGASEIDELEKMLGSAGFDRIKVAPKDTSRSFIREWMPGKGIEEYLVSATIEATKPLHS